MQACPILKGTACTKTRKDWQAQSLKGLYRYQPVTTTRALRPDEARRREQMSASRQWRPSGGAWSSEGLISMRLMSMRACAAAGQSRRMHISNEKCWCYKACCMARYMIIIYDLLHE
jgi:hypothetical protein